jgi:hypothetical protein
MAIQLLDIEAAGRPRSAVESRSVDHEVSDDREGLGTPRPFLPTIVPHSTTAGLLDHTRRHRLAGEGK